MAHAPFDRQPETPAVEFPVQNAAAAPCEPACPPPSAFEAQKTDETMEQDTEKTARKGVAIGCFVLLLIFALLAVAGVWAVKTLLGGGKEVSFWPFGQKSAQEQEASFDPPAETASVSAALPSVPQTLYGDRFSDRDTLGVTVGTFLEAYNAAASSDCRLDLTDSETLELSVNDSSCDYFFFFTDEEASSFATVAFSGLGNSPALDQPVESLFVAMNVPLKSDALPRTFSAALSALPCGEEAQRTLLSLLASSDGSGQDLSAALSGFEMYYSVYPSSEGVVNLSAGIYPRNGSEE